MKRLKWLGAALVLSALLVLVAVRLLYGGGSAYRDVNTDPASSMETLVELDFPPGNVTSAADGRIFFNTHPFARSDRFADAFLYELIDGTPTPYPNAELQGDLMFTFGMTVDAQNRLWVISPATLDRAQTRLQAFDLDTDMRVYDLQLPEGIARFSQDLRITADGKTAVLADTGAFKFTPASLIVLDLETHATRSLLVDHPSTQPQDWTIQTDHGVHSVGWGLITFAVGVDGITFSADGSHFYFATMTHDTLYRVSTEVLLDPAATLEEHVEAVGVKPLSDGIDVLPDGRVLVTDVEHGSVVTISPEGSLQTQVRSDDVVWADGVNVMKDGRVLLTDSAIPDYLDPLLRPPSLDTLEAGRPYRIHRFTPRG
jgi:sugar lactone lactonase YvrE